MKRQDWHSSELERFDVFFFNGEKVWECVTTPLNPGETAAVATLFPIHQPAFRADVWHFAALHSCRGKVFNWLRNHSALREIGELYFGHFHKHSLKTKIPAVSISKTFVPPVAAAWGLHGSKGLLALVRLVKQWSVCEYPKCLVTQAAPLSRKGKRFSLQTNC